MWILQQRAVSVVAYQRFAEPTCAHMSNPQLCDRYGNHLTQEMSSQSLLPTVPLLAVKSNALEFGGLGWKVWNGGHDVYVLYIDIMISLYNIYTYSYLHNIYETNVWYKCTLLYRYDKCINIRWIYQCYLIVRFNQLPHWAPSQGLADLGWDSPPCWTWLAFKDVGWPYPRDHWGEGDLYIIQ